MFLRLLCITVIVTMVGEIRTALAPTWDACGCRWDVWETWSQCTQTCGGGYRRRSRAVWNYNTPECEGFEVCATWHEGWQTETCNAICYNEGTFSIYWEYSGYCSCIVGTRGTCCEQIVDCGTPSTISNGNVSSPSTTYGAEATYTCDDGYNMTNPAEAVRSCSQYGYWFGSLPLCLYAESCNSSPCQNGATCDNLLGDFLCYCAQGWAGKTCELDVQTPVMTGCPVDRLVHVSELTRTESWTAPEFSDPHGFDISVTSNYEESEYEFPWGEFIVQYYAVKPSNGMTAECNFTIAVKPFPCPALTAPVQGILTCNGWRTEYANICRVSCLHGYIHPASVHPETLYVCGATGHWWPGNAFRECTPIDFAYTPIPVTQTYSGCQETDDVANISSSYIDSLSKSSFNALCLDHASSCSEENVIVKC